VPDLLKRARIVAQAHDKLGHKGVFSVYQTLSHQFWWPGMDEDIRWFVKTCDPCQKWQMVKLSVLV
jgi:hypothetical protein